MNRLKKTILILAAASLLAAGSFSHPVRAQAPTPGAADGSVVSDDEVNEIASQMFCPVCENVPLDVCPTQACHQWRETIRQLLAEGSTEAEIKAFFVERYGDRVLAEPPRSGFNWLVYIVPPVVVAAGALGLVRLMRRWRVDPAPVEQTAKPGLPADEYVRRLEEELERRA
jgi:cytochrome c-type biogenesis protein CcmH